MSDPNAPYARYYKVNRLSPGRAALVARQILRMAHEFGEAALVDLAARLLEAAEKYERVGHHRRIQGNRRGDGSAYKVDRKMDRNIKGYAEQLDTVIADHEGEPLADQAAALRHDTVPEGYYAVTGLPYEDELQAVRRIVARLEEEDEADLEAMNVLYYLRRMRALLPLYAEALEVRRVVSSGDVKTARELMHRCLCDVVGYICGRFALPAEMERRDTLLAPIDDQQDRISALMRARRLAGGSASAPSSEDEEVDALLAEERVLDEAFDANDDAPDAEAGAPDAGAPDAEAPDAGAPDAGAPDADPPRPLRPLPGGG